jgi:hypothetical protein
VVGDKMSIKEEDLAIQLYIADLLIRISVLEKLVVDKGLITEEDLLKQAENITSKIAKHIIDKSSTPQEMDKLIEELKQSVKPEEKPKNDKKN